MVGHYARRYYREPPTGYQHAQLQALLRNLLTDRFKLAVHHESKEVLAFGLVVAKGGSKLHEATRPRAFFTARPGLIQGARVSTAELASALARMLGYPVADETGLTAMYEVKVEWTPDQTSPATNADEPTSTPEPGPSLLTAVNDQLGLRLQTRKVLADLVVVDHMERAHGELMIAERPHMANAAAFTYLRQVLVADSRLLGQRQLWVASRQAPPRKLVESRMGASTDAEAPPRFPSPLICGFPSGRRWRTCVLATVRRPNCTCGFPAYSFHEATNYEIRSRPFRVELARHLSG
jgi:hypothetical protein